VVTVPGSGARLEFLPLPPAADAGPETPACWLGRTELVWEAYDPWYLRLDLPAEERLTVDASSRPSKPYGAVDRGFGHDGYPALGMTTSAAELYCRWLGEHTGGRFRLPTEAEWERACRAGGDPLANGVEAVAWVYENADDKTHPVASKPANAWGFHDLLGNAGEWCTDGEGGYTLRGGSYYDYAEEVTPTTSRRYAASWQRRDPQVPKSRWWLSDGPFVGLRLVCTEPPPAAPSAAPPAPTSPP
jgi:formylglycine-generating enzyme required for sulfatase activity